ncbi:MAG: ribonuclease R [Granulosicoccus sp.]
MSKQKSRHKRPDKGAKKGERIDPHRQRESEKYDQPIASREFITSTLRDEPGPVDFEALAEKLGLIGNEAGMEGLRRRVGAMIRDGQLIQNRRRGLVPVDADNLLAGRITAHPDGFGFVVVEDSDKDIYLNGKQMRQVLHGDRVVVCVTGVDQRGRREGRIVDVVERANKSLVGRLSIDQGIVVVLPDNKRIHQDLLIAPGELSDAVDGDMVIAEIIQQPTRRHQPVGRITEVLGQHLRPGMEIDVALHSHGIPAHWPEEVLEQAAAFSTAVDPATAKGRKDVRDTPMITIDGADARDFDDAVWCEPLDEGWRLMVAIADVAHYVSVGSALDVEAIERGTSVYFPGRVVPMLPEVLSNGLCSLNPEVDRLCMICELTLDNEGTVKKTRFHNGILRSHARLTYDQVNEMLMGRASALRKKHAVLMPMIQELHSLYKVLAKKRRLRGAIEFDSNETHIVFDENKKIKEIVPIERNDAHKLIEECMILANIQAAAYLEEKEIPALYRVHAGPKTDRLEDLRAFLSLRSLTLGGGDQPDALDYAALAEKIADRPDRSVIQTVMLRSMQQAVYQPKNEGHFGLALDQYAHFTSPIRRYPDLLVHRALKFAIARGKASKYHYSKEAMAGLGESCSRTERRAEDASRDVVAWLKCEYMQEHVGEEFDGIIAAVTSFGLFVELTGFHIEGLLHVTNLSRDYYKFNQAAQAMTGERTGKQYRLGDAIRVQVASVNLEERKIDFNEAEQSKQTRSKDKRSRKDNKARRTEQKPQTVAPVPTLGAMGKDRIVSAEQRRQQKRKLKQKRRDQKRAERRTEKRAQELAASREQKIVEVDDDGHVLSRSSSEISQERAGTGKAQQGKIASRKKAEKRVTGSDGSARSDSTAKRATHKATSKKVTSKKVTSKKVTSKKATSKKATSKKATSKKATSKKATSKKATSKKATSKKATSKKATSKKATSKKATSKKATSKKATSKKATSKKATSKKATSKKAISKKAISKKATSKKATSKKATSKKAISKKATSKKKATQKKVSSSAAGRIKDASATSGRAVADRSSGHSRVSKKTTDKAVVKKTSKKKSRTKRRGD